MRRHLLPFGLAALLYSPFSIHAIDSTTNIADVAAEVRSVGTAESAAALTLAAALELAFASNPELSAAGHELSATEASIVQAQARPNPEFSALVEDTRNSTRNTTLQLNQPIELGDKRAIRIEAATQGHLAATADLYSRRIELEASVMAAFFDVLVAQERRQLAQSSVELAQRATDAAKRRVVAGKISPVEETKARVAEANVRIELTLAGSELASARKRLASSWGSAMPSFERVVGDVETLPPLLALADLQARLGHSPGMQRARIEVERRQALTQVERSRQTPDITLSLGARRNEELNLNQAIFGISIPIPVFDRNQGNVQEALSRTDKARDQLFATEIQLSNELAFAYERLRALHQEIAALKQDILPGAESAYAASAKGFELGKFDFLDVLDAQRTLFQAKSQYLRALAEAHRSSTEIRRIVGESSSRIVAAK